MTKTATRSNMFTRVRGLGCLCPLDPPSEYATITSFIPPNEVCMSTTKALHQRPCHLYLFLIVAGLGACTDPEFVSTDGGGSDDGDNASTFTHASSLTFGTAGWDEAFDVVRVPGGGIVVGGMADSYPVNLGGDDIGSSNWGDQAVVARYDSSGGHVWSTGFQGSHGGSIEHLAVDDNGNVWIAGTYGGTDFSVGETTLPEANAEDVFLASLDSDGEPQWAIGGGSRAPYDSVGGLAVGPTGTSYLAGDALPGEDLPEDVWYASILVARINDQGQRDWVAGFGDDNDDVSDVVTDDAGNVYVTGSFSSDGIDFGGGSHGNNGSIDGFIFSLDASGSYRWSEVWGLRWGDWGDALAWAGDGYVYLAGGWSEDGVVLGDIELVSSTDSHRHFIAALDTADGSVEWVRGFGADDDFTIAGLATDGQGRIFLGGDLSSDVVPFCGGQIEAENDAWLVGLEPDGSCSLATTWGGHALDRTNAVAISDDGTLWSVGYFSSSNVNPGGGALQYRGEADGFLVSFTR